DYTIGWVTTTDEEYRAASWMVDQVHLPNSPFRQLNKRRKFNYQLSRVGNHFVAISVPILGYILNAADVIDDMRETFPQIRFVLLVGTASGVPSLGNDERPDEQCTVPDVRLGDVIVGTRTVVPCSGEAVEPPETELEGGNTRAIFTTITEFRRRLSSGVDTEPSVTAMVKQKCSRDRRFSRPHLPSDRLYRAEYPHISDRCECLIPTARQDSVTVSRAQRPPNRQLEVHYGSVCAVKHCIRDALRREELALENDVLCFIPGIDDMTDEIDCLPILGISDYADSHQYSRAWMEYAALTAAVCAKEFL
ncbi:uncharacterized protein BP01DRAFT_279399, partial [Aspergillus saccharolyticus JOP 1030-1]